MNFIHLFLGNWSNETELQFFLEPKHDSLSEQHHKRSQGID